MKNFVKKIGMIAFVAVLGLGLFTSCTEPEDLFVAGSGEQTVLKITGIEKYNDKWVIGGLDTNPVAIALGTEIKAGTVSLKILNPSAKPSYAEGYYTVILIIYNSQAEADAAKKGTEDSSWYAIGEEISKGEVTIPFANFREQAKE